MSKPGAKIILVNGYQLNFLILTIAMIIIKEINSKDYYEHDFFLTTKEDALICANTLADKLFTVGGGYDQTRVTINSACKDDVDKARNLILNI